MQPDRELVAKVLEEAAVRCKHRKQFWRDAIVDVLNTHNANLLAECCKAMRAQEQGDSDALRAAAQRVRNE